MIMGVLMSCTLSVPAHQLDPHSHIPTVDDMDDDMDDDIGCIQYWNGRIHPVTKTTSYYPMKQECVLKWLN